MTKNVTYRLAHLLPVCLGIAQLFIWYVWSNNSSEPPSYNWSFFRMGLFAVPVAYFPFIYLALKEMPEKCSWYVETGPEIATFFSILIPTAAAFISAVVSVWQGKLVLFFNLNYLGVSVYLGLIGSVVHHVICFFSDKGE